MRDVRLRLKGYAAPPDERRRLRLIRYMLPSMLVELSVVEQPYQAVLAVIAEGVPITEVAQRFGVSRQAVHRWLRRYEDQGLPGLVDRSYRPPRCAHQMDPALEVWVLEARRRNPDWGPRRLVHEATHAGIDRARRRMPR